MDKNQFIKVRQKCILDCKQKMKDSVTKDVLIVQAVSSVEELDKIINQIITRVREWYSWYNPEFSNALTDNEKFVELIIQKDKKSLLAEIGKSSSMGNDFSKKDVDVMIDLAKQAYNLINLREKEKKYLETLLEDYCPNALKILGCMLTSKLIRHAGSLEKLAMLPAPVIQIVGAEKALFKHLSKKAKSPKYGLLFSHPLISCVDRKSKGKMARAIADKAAIAVKVDFFKGKPVADEFRKVLELKAESLK